MYKVVLTDDEILTREGIAENTPWGDVGFELAGTAENGKQALELIAQTEPDLLITDICMPVMDGLELSGHVRERYPNMKIIILSGYDDFTYAKQALKYHVSNYLLKPITSLELKEELAKVRDELDAESTTQKQLKKIRKEYEDNLPVLREHLLNRIIEGKVTGDAISAQMQEYGMSLQGNLQSVLLLKITDQSVWKENYPDITMDLMNFITYNVTSDILATETNVLAFRNMNDQTVLIVSAEDEASLHASVDRIANRIWEAVSTYIRIDIYVVAGILAKGEREWQASYESSKYAVEFSYLFDRTGIIYARDFASGGNPSGIQTAPWSDKLVLLIKTGQCDEIRKCVDEFFAMLQEAQCERQILNLHIQNSVLAILITMEERETVAEGEFEQEASFINHLPEYRHLSDIQKEFTKFALTMAEAISKKHDSANQTIAVMAMDYLERNYMKPDITLNTVCDHLNLSVSYFSMVFKASTKETFIESLTKLRIEKAKRLLETTNKKNYEIAEEVGFNDPHYFGATFKKLVGQTPGEYAKAVRNK